MFNAASETMLIHWEQNELFLSSDCTESPHLQGVGGRRLYVAAQGPLGNSTHDFWRMIWEQEVGVVVMITNLVENGRVRSIKMAATCL